MSFKPINRPDGIREFNKLFRRWLYKVTDLLTLTKTYSLVINPASVNASTTSEQTFTLNGIDMNDIITINKPTHTEGFGIGNVRAAAGQVIITFFNVTGSAIDAPSETYTLKTTRK